MNKLIQFISTLVFLAIGSLLMGQPLVHSHNDYFQKLPLHTAVGAGAHSIEIDIIFSNNRLMVAHDQRDLPTAKTIDHLYFKPLINIYNNDTNALKDVQIMIDIKNEPQKVLIELEKVVNALPEFKKMLLTHKIKPLVISGSKPKSYQGWPSYILFDHQRLEDIDQIPLDKVAFFSFSFRNFTNWNGKGRLTKKDEQALSNYIEKVHALGKKIRFWATPDTKSSWYSLSSIGVDYINTDQPWECAAYLRSLSKNILKREPMQSEGEVKAYQKATINTPTQNVIFMVGDGNGLGHI
ncbi:MAG TPA: hypothetical protein PKD85_17810, partial [Saprospiraceae bacterium]|nr:hypothetical protein [Saprospiraceae bacterium]